MPIIEVLQQANPSHSAPGWAYVLESAAPDPSKVLAPKAPGKRNAARSALDALTGAHNKTQSSKIRTRLDELAKDGPGRAEVEVPAGVTKEMNDAAWKEVKGKQSTNVKRVLLSAKTWAHYAADDEVRVQSAHAREKDRAGEAPIPKTPIDPLLDTYVAEAPSEEVIAALTKAPTLSYGAIAAADTGLKTPIRRFCAMCGYWGKVKCTVCGAHVCGLACRLSHNATEHPHR
jgi:zinc finger HIT domain-containing protein 1